MTYGSHVPTLPAEVVVFVVEMPTLVREEVRVVETTGGSTGSDTPGGQCQ